MQTREEDIDQEDSHGDASCARNIEKVRGPLVATPLLFPPLPLSLHFFSDGKPKIEHTSLDKNGIPHPHSPTGCDSKKRRNFNSCTRLE
ncbi:hypothetical protein CEXT_465991 [Caerostris extrusa]|uniref:Uncharacterized protein n=1 Tax=Caerostris extrusa TaxID=172846 RepID=A0AAV4XTZ4_CAEEX|nr:hypothetical protein CEXT_465991 [Caerostris extrusa]